MSLKATGSGNYESPCICVVTLTVYINAMCIRDIRKDISEYMIISDILSLTCTYTVLQYVSPTLELHITSWVNFMIVCNTHRRAIEQTMLTQQTSIKTERNNREVCYDSWKI